MALCSQKPQFKLQTEQPGLWGFGFRLINPPPSPSAFFCSPGGLVDKSSIQHGNSELPFYPGYDAACGMCMHCTVTYATLGLALAISVMLAVPIHTPSCFCYISVFVCVFVFVSLWLLLSLIPNSNCFDHGHGCCHGHLPKMNYNFGAAL